MCANPRSSLQSSQLTLLFLSQCRRANNTFIPRAFKQMEEKKKAAEEAHVVLIAVYLALYVCAQCRVRGLRRGRETIKLLMHFCKLCGHRVSFYSISPAGDAFRGRCWASFCRAHVIYTYLNILTVSPSDEFRKWKFLGFSRIIFMRLRLVDMYKLFGERQFADKIRSG